MNAAVWLGGAVFFTVGISPALSSGEVQRLLGPANFPYFSRAISQVILLKFFHFQIACAIVAWLHVLAEWLYLGRPRRKFTFSLLAALLALALIGAFWLQPRLTKLHTASYAVNIPQAQRESAERSYAAWHFVLQGFNLLIIGGLFVYVWRVTNPPNTLRFVSSVKFRG